MNCRPYAVCAAQRLTGALVLALDKGAGERDETAHRRPDGLQVIGARLRAPDAIRPRLPPRLLPLVLPLVLPRSILRAVPLGTRGSAARDRGRRCRDAAMQFR